MKLRKKYLQSYLALPTIKYEDQLSALEVLDIY